MYTLFIILILLASFFMIAIVLIQESKGGGLASNFSSSNSIMGVRKTTDVVEKTTESEPEENTEKHYETLTAAKLCST